MVRHYSVPFPKCDHKERPQRYEETSYEWFDSACDECYSAWKAACRERDIIAVTSERWKAELNQAGRYSIFTRGSGKPSRREDGMWLRTAVTEEELAFMRATSDTEVINGHVG